MRKFEGGIRLFEFFLALFGGLHYGSKYANEKKAMKKADERNRQLIDTLMSDHDKWMKKVVDDKAEYELKNATDEEISNVNNRILTEAKIEEVTPQMILMGLLAQKGKIPKNVADSGIRSRGVWDYAEQLQWKEQRKFLLWYDRELGKNGIQEPLLFVEGSNEHTVFQDIRVACPITETNKMIGGRYFWEPMRWNVR